MRRSVPALLAAVALFAACQDATGVGLGLIGEGDDPAARVLVASALDTTEIAYPTAGFATSGSALAQSRVLVGRVADALYGDAVATAYIDAQRPSSVPDGFDRAAVTSVTLELRRDYTYGDTTAVLPIEIRLVDGNWSPEGLPADTTLGTTDVIATATLVPTDTVTTITIPAAAFAGRDTVFTSPQFGTLFEGFALSVPETGAPLPGAVAGFQVTSTQSRLRVATATDTVTFALAEVYSRVVQSPPTLAPPDVIPLRAGSPLGALRATFAPDSVGAAALARAVLSIPARGEVSEGSFKRPVASELAVYALPDAGGAAFLLLARRSSAGDLRSATSTTLTAAVQDWLLGRGTLQPAFELRFQTSPASLDVWPVTTLPGGADGAPRLVLSVVAPA